MALASPTELARWLRVDDFAAGSDDEARATLLLESATGDIDTEAGQRIEESTTTTEVVGAGTAVLVLPRWPVSSVTSVTVESETLTADEDYRVRGGTGLLIREGDVWARGEPVEVTFTAGYSSAPHALRGVCLALAGRAWRNPVGLTSESLGDWSGSWRVPGMSMTAAERRVVAAYAAR